MSMNQTAADLLQNLSLCFWISKLNLKLQDFSVQTQLLYLMRHLHVSATVSSHHQSDPKIIKINHTAAILVRDLRPYVLYKVYSIHVAYIRKN
jgi:hypothetical protein